MEGPTPMFLYHPECPCDEEVQPKSSTLERLKAKVKFLEEKARTEKAHTERARIEKTRVEKTPWMSNLPPEIKIQIYSHLSTPSEIIALNSTSRLFYQIWYENAATISGPVLSRSIDCYDSVLELLEMEKNVSEAHENAYRDTSSRRPLFREALNRNANLIAKAYELARFLTDSSIHKRRKDIIAAYYNVWTVTTLRTRQAQRERLHAASKQEFDAMTEMTIFLAMECSDAEKLALGIVKRNFEDNRWLYGYDVNWRKALITIGEASGYHEAADSVRAAQAYWTSRGWVVEEAEM